MQYIHNSKNWPAFTWNSAVLAPSLAGVKFQQGLLLGRMQDLDATSAQEAEQQILQDDVVASCALDGVRLTKSRLDEQAAGDLGVLLDALANRKKLLTAARLDEWSAAMCPGNGRQQRKEQTEYGQRNATIIKCGLQEKEKFLYAAPDKARTQQEISAFLAWYNYGNLPGASMFGGLQTYSTGPAEEAGAVARLWREPLLQAGIAHLWFTAVQPHNGASGRLARAVTDMLLHRADDYSKRFYSLSEYLFRERAAYQENLRAALEGGQDVTNWLAWFLETLGQAMEQSQVLLAQVMRRAELRRRAACSPLNERQRMVFEAMLAGDFKKMNTGTYAKLVNSSPDSALRDMQEMIDYGLMRKNSAGGRSTSYSLKR